MNNKTTNEAVVIIGAGQAGAQAAASLRQLKYSGKITLIGDEEFAPYQRPPLSKGYLSGDMSQQELFLKPDDFWEKFNISLRLSTRVAEIKLAEKQLQLSDGSSLGFSDLILATGTRPRELTCPGSELSQIFYLRGLGDADAFNQAFAVGKNVVIIGGGYVGLECAATAIKHKMHVCLLETESRILARVAGEQLSDFFTEEHKRAGVDIRLGEQAVAFHGDIDVEGVQLANGEILNADIVLVGIGVIPNVELAKAAGLVCENGITVDENCLTSSPNIYAIGDVSSHPNALFQRQLRLESVHNAIEQGKTAALSIVGRAKPYAQVPWFWSDQYDLKLQMAGLHAGHDQVVVRGDPLDRSFAVFYLKNSKLIACDAVNSPAEYMGSRMLIAQQASPDLALLANPETPMKELL